MDLFDFFRGFIGRRRGDPFHRPHGDDDWENRQHRRNPESFDPPSFDEPDEFSFFGPSFRDFGSPIDEVFRNFESHMDEMFGNFGFGSAPPSAFGFGVIDGPDARSHGETFDVVPSRPRRDGEVLSLRDEMLKNPTRKDSRRRVLEEGGGQSPSGQLVAPDLGSGDRRVDTDLDRRVLEGGLESILREEEPVARSSVFPNFQGTSRIMSKSVTTRKIGDKVVTITETVLPDGTVETNRTVINMDEDELPKFEQQWSGSNFWSNSWNSRITDGSEGHQDYANNAPEVRENLPYRFGSLFRSFYDTMNGLFGGR